MDIEAKKQQARAAGYTEEQINAYLAGKGLQQTSGTPGASSLLRGLGGGALLDTAGTGFQIGKNIAGSMGINPGENPYFSEAQKTGFSANPLKEIGASTLNDLLSSLLLAGTVFTGANATKGQVNKTTGTTVARQSEGKAMNDAELRKLLEQNLGTKDSKVIKEMTRYLKDQGLFSPAEIQTGAAQRSGPDILKMRQELSQWFSGRNFMEPQTPESVAKQSAQRTLSDVVHTMAPASKLTDWIYHQYSVPRKIAGLNLGGNLPTMIGKGIGLGLLWNKFLGPIISKSVGGSGGGGSY